MPRKRKGVDIHGWLALDKAADMTSNDALTDVKRLLKPKKAGHAGTLDPLATGVLPIAFGEATKTVPFAVDAAKTYRFTIRWGVSTDTLDAEGEAVATSEVRPDPEQVSAALPGFIGEIEQTPPVFSAVKIAGRRAYDMARAGETVELEPRPVRIDALRLLGAPSPDEAELEMRCGKGAYVRAVVRDLAAALGAEGHVAALRRTRVGRFVEEDAITLEELADLVHMDAFGRRLLPVETALDDIPALAVTDDDAARLKQGRAIVLLPHQVEELRARLRPEDDASRLALATCGGRAVAIGEVRAGRFQPTRVFQM
ncbi:MAG: tRNA pseudouridine(55) synthase TruB [Caulobacterales bacterium]|nr:tRNA pseudouridine(55) synthase TruB [Caulobacterales bacterium]